MLAAEYQLLFEGTNSTVYYQEDNEYQTPVVIKVIRDDQASPSQISSFYNEYEITQNLNLEGTRKVYKKTLYEGKPALIMEYIPGLTLKEYFQKNTLSLKEFLEIALKICQILGEIHQRKIIHKDIDSKNILLSEDKQIKIIDFGIATKLSLKSRNLTNPEKLEGTLAYISPEQTGRMNRVVDHRTDLYSLGVVFYEILTGRLPFDNRDAMELVHAHLALSPMPPAEVNKNIPEIISDIILKLLRKNAEDRYQSAYGLKADLERCLNQLIKQGKITAFELARNDYSGKLQIPQKLYGRQKEIGFLLDAFERSCQGAAELLLITGYSGVGKSALVHEIHKPITERRGFFIEGKFDQFQKNVPYSAFIQAFKSFVNLLLIENVRELEKWKNKILDAVGENAKVITDFIPGLELIIGKPPEVTPLSPTDAQNRFHRVFRNFVNAISKEDHPLVIFIDDWQWADAASMNLLKILLTNQEADYMFMIGAYRGNEISDSHPFMMILEEIKREDVTMNTVELNNLSHDHLNQLISDALQMPEEQVSNLSELIYRKTQGNAFFVNQMLKTLYEDNLLRFDFEHNTWVWDSEQLNGLNITDNVVELMASKIQKLPPKTQNVLKLAACVGNRFDLTILTIVDENSAADAVEVTRKFLEPALMEGLVVPMEDDYRFAHDRIQQAVSSLIPQEEKKHIHLKIGRLLVEHIPESKWDSHIFDITNQWNFGLELLNRDELAFVARLNYLAGQKARDSSAYKAAYNYLQIAIQCLPPDSWDVYYEFTLNIYAEMLEAVFLKGDLVETEKYIHIVKENAQSTLDKMPAFEIEMQYHISRGDQQNALSAGLNVIQMLNIPLAEAPLLIEDIDALANLPDINHKKVEAALQIMDSIITPAWSINPDLFAKITYTMVNLSIEYGNSASACVGYAFYGGLLCGKLKDIESGYKFGKLAVNLLDRYNAKFFKAKVDNLYISTVMHWKEHARATRKPHFEAVQIGLETGEIEFACYNIVESCHYQFLMGVDLESLQSRYTKNLELIRQLKQHFHVSYLTPWLQMIQNLTEEGENPTLLKGEFFDETQELEHFIEDQQLTLAFVTLQAKTILAYLFKDYEKAFEYVQLAEQYKEGVTGMLLVPVHNFLYSLILIARFPEVSLEEKQGFLRQIDLNQKDLKLWAYHAPENHLHKYQLILAETMRLSGQNTKAMDLYDAAAEGAKKYKFILEEALANELAAEFYFNQGKIKIAETYLEDSYYNYQIWGAKAKLKDIQKKYGKFLRNKRRVSGSYATSSTIASGTNSTFGPNLDMNTIIKATQALSSEVVLDNLLKKMMLIVIENAGAEKGLFILNRDSRWVIVAEANVNNPEVESMQEIPIDEVNGLSERPKLSSEVVYYVIRTRKNVVISDASRDNAIVGPNYLEKCQPKSILCLPMIHKNKLTGILYLENNLTTEAFTPDRLKILELLSTQINISIENALLYENLEEKVKERTTEVVKVKEMIEKKNLDITSSINYAKRIQNASLPQLYRIQAILPKSFIFFKPRDIVSGDFYWCSRIEPQPIYEELSEGGQFKKVLKGYDTEKFVITAVDCTGHGVPGAFMSMIGNDLLNGIVELKGVSDPAKILKELHIGVTNALNQQETDNKDGMDIALCVIDYGRAKVEFAGAKNPLVYIQNNELFYIKGDKLPVGGAQRSGGRTFTKHTISLNAPTSFYIFSDGYQDQFGGEHGRKFMLKRFKQMLLEIHEKPMEEQKEIIEKAFYNWMGDSKQIDDVLVIGFRID
ncbi:MAG: AAA family ATPase [Microscillaceae bacterium]|nr:AAA family ATPase [Microscillaceae bacterium]